MAINPSFNCGYFAPGDGQRIDPPPPGGGRRQPHVSHRERTDPRRTPGGPIMPRPPDDDKGGGNPEKLCVYPSWTCNRRPITQPWDDSFNCTVTGINGFVRLCKCAYTEKTWCSYKAIEGPCDNPPTLVPPVYDDLSKCFQNCKPNKIFDCDRNPRTLEPNPGNPTTPSPGGPSTGPSTFILIHVCKKNPGTGYINADCPPPDPGQIDLCIRCRRRIITVARCTTEARTVDFGEQYQFGPGEYEYDWQCTAQCRPEFGPLECEWRSVTVDPNNPAGPFTPTPGGGGGGITPTNPSNPAGPFTPTPGGSGGSTTPTNPSNPAGGLTGTGPQSGSPSRSRECTIDIWTCLRTPIVPPKRIFTGCPSYCVCTISENTQCVQNYPTGRPKKLTCLPNETCDQCRNRYTFALGEYKSPSQCQSNCTTRVETDCGSVIPDVNEPGGGATGTGEGNGNGGGGIIIPGGADTPGGLTSRPPNSNGGGIISGRVITGQSNNFPGFSPANQNSNRTRVPNRNTYSGGLSDLEPPSEPQVRVYFKCVKTPPTSPQTVPCVNPRTKQRTCQCPILSKASCTQEVVIQNLDGTFPPPTLPYDSFSTDSDSVCNGCVDIIGDCPLGAITGPTQFEEPNQPNNGGSTGGTVTLPGGTATGTGTSLDPFGELIISEELTQNETLAINQDFDTSILFMDAAPFDGNIVANDKYYLDIFGPYVHRSILYIFEKVTSNENWDSLPLSDLTYDNIEKSLNTEFLDAIKNIKDLDNKKIPHYYFLDVIKSKLVNGELDSIDAAHLKTLASQELLDLRIPTKTNNDQLNILKAFAYLEQRLIPLDPTVAAGRTRNSSIVPLFKTFATDLEKAIPVRIDGIDYKVYIDDNDTVIGRAGYKITDGDYVTIGTGAVRKRLYLSTEKDHAYVITPFDKLVALNLLGGDPTTTLSTSSNYSGLVEFTYDLSTPREDFYFLKLVTDTVSTAKKTPYIDTTMARYDLQKASTDADFSAINEYIKFKSNHEIYHIAYDDVFLDHMLNSSSVYLMQDDVRFDGNARKTNKSVPLLVRQMPWYIILFPTDRQDMNTFLGKSKITTFRTGNSGIVERSLVFSYPLNRDFFNPSLDLPQFVSYKLSFPNENVYGGLDIQSREMFLDKNNPIFKTGYKGDQPIPRKKSGLRIAYDIIQELTNNYIVDRGVTTFDVFSRMNFAQFNSFSTNLSEGVFEQIKSGAFGSRMYSVTKYSGDPFLFKTALVRRRASGAATDNFRQIKSTNTGYYVDPPTLTEKSKLIISRNSRPLRT